MSRVGPEDVDFAEVHDCFANTELLNIEDIGFCRKGKAAHLFTDTEFDLPAQGRSVSASGSCAKRVPGS